MNFRLSSRFQQDGESPVQGILNQSSDPNLISFAAGNPSSDAFPVRAVADISAKVLAENPTSVLQYSVSQGYPPLREALRKLLRDRYAIGADFDDVAVVSGAQQGAALTCRVLCDAGDTVICEDPSFMGCLQAFREQGAQLVGVPVEEDGMDLAGLESALQEHPNTKLIYLIPNFQNPTGITMSLSKRRRVYDLAKQYNVLILEDNPYGDLRIRGEAIPAIKTLDTTGHVIYLGSFSKILAPGVRVGYVAAHRELLKKLVKAKQCDDVHSNLLAQVICQQFITQYNLSAHIAGLREIYRRKCELMLQGMDVHFSPNVAYTRPEGGLFLWATLPNCTSSEEFCHMALQRGVATVPGMAFSPQEGTPSPSFRLNFSTPSDEQIERGTEILGRLTRELF